MMDHAAAPTEKPSATTEREIIEAVLREQLDLAKPDDLAFLESQVPYIAGCIMHRLGSIRDHSG